MSICREFVRGRVELLIKTKFLWLLGSASRSVWANLSSFIPEGYVDRHNVRGPARFNRAVISGDIAKLPLVLR